MLLLPLLLLLKGSQAVANVSNSAVQEYLAGARQYIFTYEDVNGETGTTKYIWSGTVAPTNLSLGTKQVLQTGDNILQSRDLKGVYNNLDTALVGADGEMLYIGEHASESASYQKIGIVKTAPNTLTATAFDQIDAASTATVFYFQSDGTNGAITAGNHLFACGPTGGIKQSTFNVNSGQASADAFQGLVSSTTKEGGGDTNTILEWYKVTFPSKLGTMSALCVNNAELYWVGGGKTESQTNKAVYSSKKIGKLVTDPISITAATTGYKNTRDASATSIPFTLSAADSTSTLIAGCAAAAASPLTILAVTYVANTEPSYNITDLGTGGASLAGLDSAKCVAGNQLKLSNDAGASWVQIGLIVALPVGTSTVQEYLAGAKQYIYTFASADNDSGIPKFIWVL
jgi:hypothetical protein